MKKFVLSIFAAFTVFALTGCCTGTAACRKTDAACPKADTKTCPKAKKAKACPKAKKCTMPCAKAEKCPFLGKWKFSILKDGKPVFPPSEHAPYFELCKKGVTKFHFVKDGKPVVVEGKWKVADGKLIISDAAGKRSHAYTINNDGTASIIVGKGKRLPENSKIVICKEK